MKSNENILKEFLPAGWEEAAKAEGALVRSRQIKTPQELLHLNLLYLTEAGSYQNTSTLMALSTEIRLNKEATRKRIQGSWPWLRWMAEQLCREQGYSLEPPEWLAGRRVQLVDATDVALHGSVSSNYRLHYLFDLFAHSCTHMELTPINGGGEKLNRFTATSEDIFVADRIYGTISGMEHLRAAGAGFVLRLRTNAFTLYDVDGNVFDILPHLRQIATWGFQSLPCFYKGPGGEMYPIRIVATRKDEDASTRADRRLSRIASRKQQREVSSAAREMGQYIVLATNIPDTADRVLALYRARWQIECVFHRLKGLFSFGEPPGANPDSVKAWFYGKLFLAALCEAAVKQSTFPPG